MTTNPEALGRHPEVAEVDKTVFIRPFEDKDCVRAVEIARKNFRSFYAPLFSKDVVDAYVAANRSVDLEAACNTDGTEAYVAEVDGKVSGFFLIRYNIYPRRHPQGELELRRLHVDEDYRGQKIGTRLLDLVEKRGKEIGVELLVSLASGSSRSFFEQNGWSGRTELHPMPKRQTSALVFAAQKLIVPEPIPLYNRPTHIVYAGENPTKEEFIRNFIKEIDSNISVYGLPTEESFIPDVFEAAKSKALSVKLDIGRNVIPLVIASDIRDELLQVDSSNPNRYTLANRGKPARNNSLEEIRENFALLLDTAKKTRKPAPYIVRSATYLHNPLEPDKDTFTEHDTSIWLCKEGLGLLSTPEGLAEYRDETNNKFGVDITQMSAGFALPIFLERGYVVGINGHPFDLLPHKDQVVAQSLHTALAGMDGTLIKRRLGYL